MRTNVLDVFRQGLVGPGVRQYLGRAHIGHNAARAEQTRELFEVSLKREDRCGEDDEIRLGYRVGQIPGDSRGDPEGLGLPPCDRTMAVTHHRSAGHALLNGQGNRTAQKPQPYHGYLT